MSVGKFLATLNFVCTEVVLEKRKDARSTYEVMLFNTHIIKNAVIVELLNDSEYDEEIFMEIMDDYGNHINEWAGKNTLERCFVSERHMMKFIANRVDFYEEEFKSLLTPDRIVGKLLYCFIEDPLCSNPKESSSGLSQIMIMNGKVVEMVKLLESEIQRLWKEIEY